MIMKWKARGNQIEWKVQPISISWSKPSASCSRVARCLFSGKQANFAHYILSIYLSCYGVDRSRHKELVDEARLRCRENQIVWLRVWCDGLAIRLTTTWLWRNDQLAISLSLRRTWYRIQCWQTDREDRKESEKGSPLPFLYWAIDKEPYGLARISNERSDHRKFE